MLGLSYYNKSINGIKTLTDGKVIIQNGSITNVNDIQGSSATFDNLNSQEIQQLIYDVSLNQTNIQTNSQNIELNTQQIQTNTLSISNLQTSVDNDVSILEGQIEQNALNILDNENAIIQIQAIQSQPLNRLIDQSNNVVGENILMPTKFLGNISVNGDVSGNIINANNIIMNTNGTIVQGTNTNYNYLSKTEINDLIVVGSMTIPSNVEIPASVHTGDLTLNDAVILQTNVNPSAKVNALSATDFFNGDVKVFHNFHCLSTTSLNNLNVSGTSNLGVINSQTITSINNNISSINNEITTITNEIVDISNNIILLDTQKSDLLNPTFPNDVSILNLLTCRINPLLIIDNGNELSDNYYLCTHRTARLIAQHIIDNNIHNTIQTDNLITNSLTTTNIDITKLGLKTNSDFKWYDRNDTTSDLLGNGTYTIGDYKTSLGATQLAVHQISSGDNGSQSIFITSGGDFNNLHQSIQAWDTFRHNAIPLKIQPLGGDTQFGGNITSPTITSLEQSITANTNSINDLLQTQTTPLNRLIDQSNNVVGENILMPTKFLGNISVNGDISGNTINTTNILFNGTLNQQPNLNYNFLSKTEVSDLIITTSLTLPSDIEIPGSNHTSDIQITNAKIIQTNTDPNNINTLTGTDFNGNVEISNNLDVLSTTNLNNLNVSGSCNLPIINSQTITNINNDITTINSDITAINTEINNLEHFGNNSEAIEVYDNTYTLTNNTKTLGLVDLNVASFQIKYFKATISVDVPISLYREFQNVSQGGSFFNRLENQITNVSYSVYKNGVLFSSGNCDYNNANALTNNIEISFPASTSVQSYNIYCSNFSCSFTPDSELSTDTYDVKYTITRTFSDAYQSFNFISIQNAYYVNTDISATIPSSLTFIQGSIGQNYSAFQETITKITNYIPADSNGIVYTSHLITNDLQTNNLTLPTMEVTTIQKVTTIQNSSNITIDAPKTIIPNNSVLYTNNTIAGYMINGPTTTSNGNYIMSGDFDIIPIPAFSLRRTIRENIDDVWVINPGFGIRIYLDGNYSSTNALFENFNGSQPIAERSIDIVGFNNSVNSYRIYYLSEANELTCPILS